MGFFSNLFHHDDVSGTKKYVSISGMVCQNCVNHATQALEAVPGVKKAKVNLMRGEAEVIVDDSVKDEDLLKAVVNAGYAATDISLHPKKIIKKIK